MSLVQDPEVRKLLRAAQAGDKAAFERLIAPHLPRLYHLAYHLIQHSEDAADAVQDTAIKAYRNLAGFREEADLGTWLARILRNNILDEVKRAVRRHEEATEVLPERADPVTEPAVERRELQELLMGYIQELSPKLREPLILFDLEGYSYDDIATIMDLNLGTVKSRLNRARLALRERILERPGPLASYLPEHLFAAWAGAAEVEHAP